MMFWLVYLRFGFSFFQNTFGYLEGVNSSILWLVAVSAVFSLAVQDWNSFVFVSKRIKDFRTVISNIFKVETAVSAAISVAVAEVLVLAWVSLNPGYSEIANSELFVSILKGFFIGSISGIVLGFLLTYLIRYLLTSKAQLVLAAVAFLLLVMVSVFAVHQGGYLSALIMGIVTCCPTGVRHRMKLSSFQKSLNLSILLRSYSFFAIGLGLQPILFSPASRYLCVDWHYCNPTYNFIIVFQGPFRCSGREEL